MTWAEWYNNEYKPKIKKPKSKRVAKILKQQGRSNL